MLSVQLLHGFKIHEVVVVSIDDHLVHIAYKVQLPSHQSVDDGKKFFVVDVPVSLHCIKCP